MKQIFLFFLFTIGYCVYGQEPVFHLDFNEENGVAQTIDRISGEIFEIQNHYNFPERYDSPFEKALRLDGWTTWASNQNFFLEEISNAIAIELWWATECFNEQAVGLISQVTSSEGIALKVLPFGQLSLQYFADGKLDFITTSRKLDRYRWNHIIAQVDLTDGLVEIWVNGELWNSKKIEKAIEFTLGTGEFFVGRGNDSPMNGPFLLSAANGAIDEVQIYNEALSPIEISDHYNSVGYLETNLEIDIDLRHGDDHLRPRYHVMPNTSWTNESYGLTYFAGKYHMFSQKNANSPSLYFMHWGHYSSPDLVSWKEERMSLAPEPGFSDFGCWSGTTILDDDGRPVISYTGVNGQFAGIGMAYPIDSNLIQWELEETNPVVPRSPSNIPNLDFRDPYIIKDGSFYYMMVGSGKAGNQGGFLASYRSTDLVTWDPIDPIFEYSNTARAGIFWEMPALVKLENGDWMMVVTPVYAAGPAQTLYWIGDFSGEKFIPFHDDPIKFEHNIRLLLSPAFGIDSDGRNVYIGIIPEDRNTNDQIASGWRQTFSIPRVIRPLSDGKIGHYPHPNLCRLRKEQTTIQNRIVSSGTNFNLPEITGNQQFEIELTLVPKSDDTEFSLQILKNESASLFTSIYGDLSIDRLGINRQLSSPYSTTEDNRYAPYVFRDTVFVRLFFDHSVLEVFVDNLTVMSTRVYPGEDQTLVDLIVSKGEVEILNLNYWKLGNKEELYPNLVCEPEFLPERFPTSIDELIKVDDFLNVYPNPAKSVINVSWNDDRLLPPFELTIFDNRGTVPIRGIINSHNDSIDISRLPSGLYFIEITNDFGRAISRFVKE